MSLLSVLSWSTRLEQNYRNSLGSRNILPYVCPHEDSNKSRLHIMIISLAWGFFLLDLREPHFIGGNPVTFCRLGGSNYSVFYSLLAKLAISQNERPCASVDRHLSIDTRKERAPSFSSSAASTVQ
jgi:hypothetical protein